MSKKIILIILVILLFNLLGCIKQMMGKALMSAGVTEEELELLGLSEFFGIKRVQKPNKTRVELPKFEGVTIMYFEYPEEIVPGDYGELVVTIGANYYGISSGKAKLRVSLPVGFKISEPDIYTEIATNYTVKGSTVEFYYDKIEYGEGDVVIIPFLAPPPEISGFVAREYPITMELLFNYSTVLRIDLPAASTLYIRQIGEIGEPEIETTAGEVKLKPINLKSLKIPESAFDIGEYKVPIKISVENEGKGIVMGSIVVYFLGVRTNQFSVSIEGPDWNCNNIDDEIRAVSNSGLDELADILKNAKNNGVVCFAKLSPGRKILTGTLVLKLSPALKTTRFTIPLFFATRYEYYIRKKRYIVLSK